MSEFDKFMIRIKKDRTEYESRCNHSKACTGTFQWNGLTYCSECCRHNFGNKNFVCELNDGFSTCTLCWIVVGQCFRMVPHPGKRVWKKTVKPTKPKITLTRCDGKSGRVSYTK